MIDKVSVKEIQITGQSKNIRDLFEIFRLNGIESTIPVVRESGRVTIQCMPSVLLDRIIPPWKDQVTCKTITVKR